MLGTAAPRILFGSRTVQLKLSTSIEQHVDGLKRSFVCAGSVLESSRAQFQPFLLQRTHVLCPRSLSHPLLVDKRKYPRWINHSNVGENNFSVSTGASGKNRSIDIRLSLHGRLHGGRSQTRRKARVLRCRLRRGGRDVEIEK